MERDARQALVSVCLQVVVALAAGLADVLSCALRHCRSGPVCKMFIPESCCGADEGIMVQTPYVKVWVVCNVGITPPSPRCLTVSDAEGNPINASVTTRATIQRTSQGTCAYGLRALHPATHCPLCPGTRSHYPN